MVTKRVDWTPLSRVLISLYTRLLFSKMVWGIFIHICLVFGKKREEKGESGGGGGEGFGFLQIYRVENKL